MDTSFADHRDSLEGTIDHLQRELQAVRTGRATPSLVENISVVAYETPTPLAQLATINAPDPKTISIQPWDKSLAKAIEKAIQDANVGLSAVSDGAILRITMPMMTEENRKQLARVVRDALEEARIAIRAVREKIKEKIMEEEKAGELSEDDRFRLLKKLDEHIREYTTKAEGITSKKEEEIMAI